MPLTDQHRIAMRRAGLADIDTRTPTSRSAINIALNRPKFGQRMRSARSEKGRQNRLNAESSRRRFTWPRCLLRYLFRAVLKIDSRAVLKIANAALPLDVRRGSATPDDSVRVLRLCRRLPINRGLRVSGGTAARRYYLTRKGEAFPHIKRQSRKKKNF